MEKMGAPKEELDKCKELMKGFIKNPIKFLWQHGKDIIEGLKIGIKEALGLNKPGKNIKQEVKNNVGNDAGNWLKNIGRQIVQGLINGIMSMVPGLNGAASTIAGIVGNVVKLKNKIGSPSRLMEYYGEMLGEGYINGMDSMKNAISKTALDTFSLSPQLANSMSLNNSPEEWADNILKDVKRYKKRDTKEEVSKYGFNIGNEANKMGEKYCIMPTFAKKG
jgi:hypothetical protein